jgi:hypothetical protein
MEDVTGRMEEGYLRLPVFADQIAPEDNESFIEEDYERFIRKVPNGSSLEFLEFLPEDTKIYRGWNWGTERGLDEDWTFLPNVAMGFSNMRNGGLRRTVSVTTAGKLAKYVRSAIRIIDPEENETCGNHIYVDVGGMQIKDFISRRIRFRNVELHLEKNDYRIS